VSVPGKSFFYTASGVDLRDGAGPDDCVLLSSGCMVAAHSRPKGIQAGQFTIPFAFPTGRAADEVAVTDDANSKARLPPVNGRPCPPSLNLRDADVSTGGRAICAAVADASSQYATVT
jgi:hypothetical protein